MTISFRPPFSIKDYGLFIRTKLLPEQLYKYDEDSDSYTITTSSRFARIIGVEAGPQQHGLLPIAGHLFDYQDFITRMALDAKRYAIWADTGLGKTAMFLEYARQVRHKTDARVLMVSPLQIIPQTMDEARKFYGSDGLGIIQLHTKEELRRWCEGKHCPENGIAMVNYEKFIPRDGEQEVMTELRLLAGVVLDESSVLRSGGGKIKWAIIKSCRGIEHKLSCTATPAPNDTMEYASQASFLEKLRSEGEILWTYFTKTKTGDWKVKEHAREAFYRFMSGWSVYLRSPAHYGFDDNLKDVPTPEYNVMKIKPTLEQSRVFNRLPATDGQFEMFGTLACGMTQRVKLSQVAKGFMYLGDPPRQTVEKIRSEKPGVVVDLALADKAEGRQVLVWTSFDAESDILAKLFKSRNGNADDVVVLTGKTPQSARYDVIERFRRGDIQVLISRPQMVGYGLNFQFCTSMVFSGFTDSFQDFYQAIRRCYRYGQTKAVRVHIPYIEECEGMVYDNIRNKEARFIADVNIMERHYIEAMKAALTKGGRS